MGNLGSRDELIAHGDRVAQLVVAPVVRASYLQQEEGERPLTEEAQEESAREGEEGRGGIWPYGSSLSGFFRPVHLSL